MGSDGKKGIDPLFKTFGVFFLDPCIFGRFIVSKGPGVKYGIGLATRDEELAHERRGCRLTVLVIKVKEVGCNTTVESRV